MPTLEPRPLDRRQLGVLIDAHLAYMKNRIDDHVVGLPVRSKEHWIELRTQINDEIARIDDCVWRLDDLTKGTTDD